ncbi:unnamed protein product [Cladocopium goreaui]|uniref:Pentatricopeptide repeat-containing protein, chloroplastic n=1 Tax=Cladocopium goreaui TaxID=2562237 RepID=A0A9P1FWT2_9DINO|nr:unnamed protein product [Cladocopium goreaui]
MSTHSLTERYLAEDVYEDVLGMLENDDTLPPEKRIPHREVGLGGLRSQMIRGRGIRSHPFLS